MQPLWETGWSFLRRLKIEPPPDSAIPLVRVSLKETQRGICPVPCDLIYNIRVTETAEVSTGAWVDEENVISLSHAHRDIYCSACLLSLPIHGGGGGCPPQASCVLQLCLKRNFPLLPAQNTVETYSLLNATAWIGTVRVRNVN